MNGVWPTARVSVTFLLALLCVVDVTTGFRRRTYVYQGRQRQSHHQHQTTPPPPPPPHRQPHKDKDDSCVRVDIYSGYGAYRKSVATCDFAESLQESIESLQQNLTELAMDTAEEISTQHGKIKALQMEVDELQGDNTELIRIVYTDPVGDSRLFCEVFTYGEVSEICRLLGFDNGNVHFVHRNCEKDGDRSECPDRFWKFRQGCFKPNDPVVNGLIPFFQCIRDPEPGETCDNVMFIGCEGYTTNFNDFDWMKIAADKA